MNRAELGEVAKFINGAAFKPADWGEEGRRIIRIQNLNDPSKPFNRTTREVADKYLVETGNLLVSWSASLGVFEWHEPDTALLNQHIFKVVPDPGKVHQAYLRHMLENALTDMSRHHRGSTMVHVNRKEFLGTTIPLPPLEEQKRIAGILDQADALRRLRTRAVDKLNTLGQAIFHEMFGDVVGNSKGFEQQNLTDALNFTTGKLDSNAAVDGGEFPFFTCAKEISAIDKFAFDGEALLLAGNNASADYDVKYYNGKFNAYQRTYVLTLATPELRYRFVQRSLETMLGEMKRFSKGSNTKYLTMEIFRRMKICKPDIELQDRYIQRAEALYAEIAKAENAASKYDNLFASLQHRAFRGEL
tara:strand:- start:7313 stop:8392 length:1080 start_codon:yes stop_codon:yes gene_type:complete